MCVCANARVRVRIHVHATYTRMLYVCTYAYAREYVGVRIIRYRRDKMQQDLRVHVEHDAMQHNVDI